MQEIWRTTVPKALDGVVKGLKKHIEKGGALPPPEQLRNLKAGSFPMSITIEQDEVSGEQMLKAEVTAGRAVWLEEMKRLLESTAKVLCGHEWIALRPHAGSRAEKGKRSICRSVRMFWCIPRSEAQSR